MPRAELNRDGRLPSGKELSKVLSDLAACGFIREFRKPSPDGRGLHCQLTDPFTRFHFDVIEPRKVRNKAEVFRRQHPAARREAVHTVLVTLYGAERNAHFREAANSAVDAEALFS